MRIFTSKLPRTWRSSGVTIKSDQLEMSNFSFVEEYFTSNSTKFNITIIGKNIIGNGAFSIAIYKESFLVWQEDFSFEGISFSKKQVEIEESSGQTFKIVISRGKRSKGRVLINQVFIYQEKKKELKIESLLINDSPDESEPTYFIEKNPLLIPEKIIENKESVIIQEDIILPEPASIKKERIKRKVRYIKVRSIKENVVTDNIEPPIITDQPSENDFIISRPTKDIWIMVIDFDITNDERSIFNYLNQISFGRDKQIFFVKQSSLEPIDFSKYEHVRVFFEDIQIIESLKFEWPKKITFLKENLQGNLLKEVERIKDEISK